MLARQVVLLNPPESTHPRWLLFYKHSAPANSFRIRTCKSVSKQRTSTPFRMNTYKKPGGRGVLLLTKYPTRIFVLRSSATIEDSDLVGKNLSAHSRKSFCPERPSGARDLYSLRPARPDLPGLSMRCGTHHLSSPHPTQSRAVGDSANRGIVDSGLAGEMLREPLK